MGTLRWLPLIVALLLAAYAASAAPKVAILSSPGIVRAGETVQLTIRVEPNQANRLLVVEAADDGGTVRRTDEQLEGDKAPRTRWLSWIMPPCEGGCVFVSALYGVNGFIARDTKPVTVLDR